MRHTEETRTRMSAQRMGDGNPFYGRTHTAEVKKRLSEHARIRNRGYRWTRPDGGSFVRGCLDEDDARETVEAWPGRAEVVAREIRVGPWVVATKPGGAA